MGASMTGRVTGRTVVNGVPAVNVFFTNTMFSGDKLDLKILDERGMFAIGDTFTVERNGE